MKIKKLFIVFLVILLLFSGLPPYEKASAAEQKKIAKTNIEVPNPLATVNGERYLGTDRSGDLGTIDISTLGLPANAKINSVQVYTMDNKYVKHLNDKTGTVYKIGTVPNVGTAELKGEVKSGLGYFEWFRQGGHNRTWAFDLDGVRHVRMYDSTVAYPSPNGRYINIREGTGGYPSTSYPTGNIPTWYNPPTPNHRIIFDVETAGNADIGWAQRYIDIGNVQFKNDSLGISNIPLSKLSNIDVTQNDVVYVQNDISSAVRTGDITNVLVMEDGPTMLANKRVNIWFGARMKGNYERRDQANGTYNARYYNEWKVNLTSTIYKYTKYQIVVFYDGEPSEKLRIEGGNVCLNEPKQFKAILFVPVVGDWDGTNSVQWSSSDTSVATVNKGLVTPKKAGNIKITAIYTDNATNLESKATIDVKVSLCGDAALTLTANVPSCPKPNDTIQIRAKIQKKDGYVWEFLITEPHAKLVYKSSNTAVATVSNVGLITIKSTGSVVITATYTEGDGSEPIVETINITVPTSCDGTTPGGGTPPGGGGSCDYTISTGTGGVMQSSFLNATPTGFIDSQTGEFDVVQGIPSSESLKTEATMQKYLFDQMYEQQTGKVTYTVSVSKTFTLEWEETPPAGADDEEPPQPEKKSETEVKEVEVQVEREFSYWNVKKFDVWTADRALIENYALPNGQSLMMVYDKVTANAVMDTDVNNHVFPTECAPIELPAETVNGGSSKPSVPDIDGEAQSAAESEIQPPDVKNDSAIFNGTTLMDDSLTSSHGPTPTNIPYPTEITVNNYNLLIEPTKTNYWQSPSTGKVTYQGVFGLSSTPSEIEFNFAVNNVTVHTPVVLYSNVSDDKEHDQRINPPYRSNVYNPNTEIAAFVLDRVVTVYMPTIGQHRNIPGYGYKDYQKYIKSKQVKFPFDIYSETEAAYYPANTWINVPVDLQQVNFKMPSWVTEERYVIDFRAFAINAPQTADFGGTEREANISIPNGVVNGNPSAAHSVEDSITVDVIGRLFDLKVTDITDFNWQDVFRKQDGLTHSGNYYTVGLGDIDGASNGNTQLYTLPISHYSHPSKIKNLATKLGYSFRFDLKTKGEMQWNDDAIRIKPTFYFVKNDGSGRQEVDLYYHDDENEKYFIKIGSDDDNIYRTIKLNNVARNVSTEELTNNGMTYYDYADKFNLSSLKSQYFKNSFGRHYIRHLSKEDVETGPYGWQILNWKLRTYINEVPTNMTTTMIPKDQIVTKEQQWYGEYSLPAKTYVVAKGTKIQDTAILNRLNDNHPIFMKDGYIVVNFDIETIRDGNINQPYLSYHKGYYTNQWKTHEKGKSAFTDGYGNTFSIKDGDMIYYYANQSSNDDFKASITH